MPSITMPRLSDSMVDGTIVTWLRADGDEIEVGDEIVEIETDKAIMPYQAEYAGTLRIVVAEGEVMAVGGIIGHIGEPDAVDEAAAAPAVAAASSATQSAAAVAAPPAPGARRAPEPVPAHANGRLKASPVAKRLAAAFGIDLTMLTGTGPGGRIVKRDVHAASPAPGSTASAAAAAADAGRGRIERRPLTATQATIARRMVEAKAVPEFTVTVTSDVEELLELRGRLAQLEHRLSPGDFVIRACALALREHPDINASYTDDAVQLFSRINIGMAVAAGGGRESLLVPTLYDADAKSVVQIARETRALAERARTGQLGPAEMSNATFTVSNLGMYGVSHFTAVLNPPQAAILAVGAAEQRVVARDGGFEARHHLTLTMTSDHRVIYGAAAAAFLASVRENLENPLKLVL